MAKDQDVKDFLTKNGAESGIAATPTTTTPTTPPPHPWCTAAATATSDPGWGDEGGKVCMDPNKKTEALAHAYRYAKFAETVRYLVANGADPKTAADSYGYTPLHYAASYKDDLDLVQYLVGLGAKPDAAYEDGWTVLHSAAANSRLNVVQYLVGLGREKVPINPKMTKAAGEHPIGSTPLDWAKDQAIKDFLTQNGAESGIAATPTTTSS
jgi:hypothetical protein